MIRILTAALWHALLCSFAMAQSGAGWETPKHQIAGVTPMIPDLATINTLQDAVADAWQKMPLTQRRAIFVSVSPDTYGTFDERKSNSFKPGEKLITYVEPIGYSWTQNADGTYTYGVTLDFTVKRPDGKILGGQEKFLNFNKTSRVRNQELMVVSTLSLDGFAPGAYLLEYKLHDTQSRKESKIVQSFVIEP